MGIADIAILAAVAAVMFFSLRWLLRANKNGCSDCGGSCSAHEKNGHCSKADAMLADAESAFAKKGARKA